MKSPHPTEKIAAAFSLIASLPDPAWTNARPAIINDLNIPLTTKIADRSLYVHAETRALLNASRKTQGGTLLVTDPLCPNCMKQVAMAGIKNIVIDGDGFAKPYFAKNDSAFQIISLSIAKHFGVTVSVFDNGQLQRLSPSEDAIDAILDHDDLAILPLKGILRRHIRARGKIMRGDAFTFKYDARIEALHVALMQAAKKDLKPDPLRPVVLSEWPASPRPFIDALEKGLTQYVIADKENAPDWAGALEHIGIEIA